MVLPAVTAGLSLASGVAGLLGGRAKNRQAQRIYQEQQRLGKRQEGFADDLNSIIGDLLKQNPNMTDAYGYGTTYDPVTGEWRSTVDPMSQQIQGASDQEELARYTVDQEMRRAGLQDSEALRGRAAVEAGTEMDALAAARSGVNRLDVDQIAGIMGADRTRAINAGYDDAMRAANAVSLRTGGDGTQAFQALARNRANDIARLGNPMLDAISFTDNINQNRDAAAMGRFGQFMGEGRDFYDAGFGPSDRFDKAFDRQTIARNLFTQNKQLGMAGKETAAGITANQAAGMQRAGQQRLGGTDYALGSKFIGGLNNVVGGLFPGKKG